MSMFIWLWLGAIVLFGVAEVVTESMVSIWFVVGSLVGLSPEATQALVFAVVSALALAATRPLVRRFMTRPHIPTNSDRVLGMVAKVTEAVDNDQSSGAVYVDGKTWTARSADGAVIPAGTQVKVQKIEGVKLLVQYSEKVEVRK